MRHFVPVLVLAVSLYGQTAREFRLTNLQDYVAMQEAATILRSTAEARDVRVDQASRTLSISGSPWQLSLAEWLIPRLDRAPNAAAAIEQYTIAEMTDDPVVRVYHPARAHSAEALQELSTMIRSTAAIRRASYATTTRTLVMRTSPEESAAADWIFKELDQNAHPHTASASWRMPGVDDGVIRVFYLSPSLSRDELLRHLAAVRMETNLRYMFQSYEYRAVVARGTGEQIETAMRLLEQRGVAAARSRR